MQKIKHFLGSEKGKDVLMILVVILVGTGSFELGRLSKSGNSSGIRLEYMGTELGSLGNQAGSVIGALQYAPEYGTPSSSGKNFFASSRGKKYYPVGCSAGKTIKLENRIYFETGEEAEKAGYELSGSCN